MIELMVVIIIIGILATLAYSSLVDTILTNRAKETAQTIRTFTEKALMDAKRRNETVTIELSGNNIKATIGNTVVSEALGMGYEPKQISPVGIANPFKNSVVSENRLGLSGISKEGYLMACGFKDYCGGAVKTKEENSLISTNRAKETAQTMRTFAERALIEGKRLNKSVTIKVYNNVIEYTVEADKVQEQLHSNFSGSRKGTPPPNCENVPNVSFNDGAVSQLRIGISGIVKGSESQGYFVACDTRDYCGAAVKVDSKNSFVACIKKGASASWVAL